ncbi:hypothetical protein FT663_03988 [Candidozyma haemuli var. vulneris]|uniref:BZIP domain-containing protein n=1 Tax=Candidozyma haemuli TaxID=45357 RepID=A0A2V1AW88_9ASCO|nr:hypothetical protein CXQ85_000565 [[Candida] haemuloni]KAF3985033.1 hypothetical protein FT662_05397 [[Candida] haemuloni var. vulneris]KAF3988519.1 hypothetical protein FT663_03988 [[Candida] haemuloni var. vulneris]PVH21583.1 hypothetical protein CXQ85_000565 [[Candida] haemuloni]
MPETSNALIDQLVYIDNFINTAAEDTPNLDVDSQLSLDLAAFADDSFVFPDEEKPKHEDESNDHDDTPFHHELGSNSASLNNNNNSNSNDAWFSQSARQHRKSFKDKDSNGPKGLSVNERTKLAKLNRLHHYNQNSNESSTPTLPSQAHPEPSNETHVEENVQNNSLLSEPQRDLSNLPKFPVPPGAKTSLEQAGLSSYQIDLLSALIAQHQGNLTEEHADPFQNQHSRNQSGIDYPSTFAIAPTLAYQTNAVDTPGSVNSAFSSESSRSNSALATPSVSSTGDFGMDRTNDLDKRKRNTAASARFRIKKKMKEKEMEAKISSLDDHIRKFEVKVSELEMENRLLKNLIIEKGNRNSDEELLLLKERIKVEKRS